MMFVLRDVLFALFLYKALAAASLMQPPMLVILIVLCT